MSYPTTIIIGNLWNTQFDTLWLFGVFSETTCLNLMKPFAHESPLTCGENDATYSLIVPHLDPEKLSWKVCKETDVGKKKYSFAAIPHNFMGHKKCSSIFSFSSILSQFHRERRSFPWPLVREIIRDLSKIHDKINEILQNVT